VRKDGFTGRFLVYEGRQVRWNRSRLNSSDLSGSSIEKWGILAESVSKAMEGIMKRKKDNRGKAVVPSSITRRDFLKGVGVAASGSMIVGDGLQRSMRMSPIAWKEVKLTGYSDRLSVAQGETIQFMVSSEAPQYRADIVRLIHGDPNPKGPGFKEQLIDTPTNDTYHGREQKLKVGSYIIVPHNRLLQLIGSFSLQAWVYPTTAQKGLQGILTKWSPNDHTGYGLFVAEDGGLALWISQENGQIVQVATGKPLRNSSWYFVAATYDAGNGAIVLYQEPVVTWPLRDTSAVIKRSVKIRSVGQNGLPLLVGAFWESASGGKPVASGHFNGKIDSPRIFGRALNANEIEELKHDSSPSRYGEALVAAWDFSADISSKNVTDISPNALHGETINMPARAMTGHNWIGTGANFKDSREEYGAIYFHDDDLEDAGWEVGFEFDVPSELRSGIYAARLRAGTHEDYLPFFVRPKKGTSSAPVAYLIPTFTYLAYANKSSKIPGLQGLYDHHTDDSGVCYASRRRPLLDMRPNYSRWFTPSGRVYPRHFGADLYLVDWMEAKGHQYDIITDEDLHLEGAGLLAPYKTVVTGSHPEYWSGQMLDGLRSYLENGGRLMYLGGNGFYWATSSAPDQPHLVEVRRWGGTEAWEAKSGEYHHSTTGELGGLWRHRGRPPQKLVGVGFTSQGWVIDSADPNRPYVRKPGSFDPRASFIFEGIGPGELIGDFESLGLEHGAAGDEIDRFDEALGSPAHTLVLATASNFSKNYLHVVEEIHASRLWDSADPLVRSDMVYFEYPNGGAVFSVGSISWFGSLSYNRYNNDVSRITDNVMRRFVSGNPLPPVKS
jgi:N,N-dimethylformamidase beta subunit-like, C-terminal/Concanavalin A-like lectin/glucanases superfamily